MAWKAWGDHGRGPAFTSGLALMLRTETNGATLRAGGIFFPLSKIIDGWRGVTAVNGEAEPCIPSLYCPVQTVLSHTCTCTCGVCAAVNWDTPSLSRVWICSFGTGLYSATSPLNFPTFSHGSFNFSLQIQPPSWQ